MSFNQLTEASPAIFTRDTTTSSSREESNEQLERSVSSISLIFSPRISGLAQDLSDFCGSLASGTYPGKSAGRRMRARMTPGSSAA